MFLAFQVAVDSVAKRSGSLSMDDTNRTHMCNVCIIQIFIQFGDSLIHSLSKEIDLRAYCKRFAHLHLAGGGTSHLFGCDGHRFLDDL